MGALRLLLALLVATSHLAVVVKDNPEILCGQAVIAVRLFFVLSGFYMALVSQAPRSRYRRATDFYMSRLLKLLPMYWVLSAITFAIAASTRGDFFPLLYPYRAWHGIDMSTLQGGALAYIATTLISLIGSDTWTWLGVESIFRRVVDRACLLEWRDLGSCLIRGPAGMDPSGLNLASTPWHRYLRARVRFGSSS